MAETHEFKSFELFDSWADTFLEIYHSSQNPKEHSNVAIVDFMENATEMEFQIFAEHFKAHGFKAQLCEIQNLQYKDGTLYTPDGMQVDVDLPPCRYQ